MSTREILRRERQRKDDKAEERERRRRLRIEKHERALAASKMAGRRRVLRLPEVEVMTGLKHSIIYELISQGSFPPPVELTATARGWVESEIDDWLDQRIAERDAGTAVARCPHELFPRSQPRSERP
jgi:prophage regulatory protein